MTKIILFNCELNYKFARDITIELRNISFFPLDYLRILRGVLLDQTEGPF